MSFKEVQLKRDSRLGPKSLTEAEYSEKFEQPNNHRLQKESTNGTVSDSNSKVQHSNDNPSFVHDVDIEEKLPAERSAPLGPPIADAPVTATFKKSGISTKCLWIVIVILVILLATMTALFVWRIVCCSERQITPTATTLTSQPTKPPPAPGGCISLPRSVNFPTLPGSIQKELDDFKAFLIQAVGNNQTVSVSANVVYRDEVIMEGAFGVMDRIKKTPRSPTVLTPYPCASVSKILTAVMLLKLVNDGKVRSLVHDTVVEYEPKFDVNNPFNDHNITLWELATHTSGLPREGPCYPDTSTNLCPYDYNTMMNRIKNITLVQEPGKVPQYSNLGFSLLGQVLFKRFSSEPTFTQWMEKELLSKLEMHNTTFAVNRNQTDNIPVGYLYNMKSYPIQDWGWLQPSGGMFASVNDLAKLQIDLMSDKSIGRLISYELVQEFFKPNYVFPGGMMIGSPWSIIPTDNGYHLREYAGFIYGYNTYMVMVPEIRLGLNLQCTGCNGKLSATGRTRFQHILNVFNDELTRASLKNLTMPPDPRLFIGRYNSSIPVIAFMEVKEKKGDSTFLTLAVNGFEAFYLDYKSPRTFHIKMNPVLDCINKYTFGVENDVVIFDKPSIQSGVSPGFVMYGAHPSGYSYFHRQ